MHQHGACALTSSRCTLPRGVHAGSGARLRTFGRDESRPYSLNGAVLHSRALPALDATLWDEPTTGIALYTRELHRALTQQGLDVQRWGAARSGELPRRRRNRTLWTLAELPKLLNERRPSLFHAVSNFNLPLQRGPVPFVLTLHDLVPLLLPGTVSTRFRWQFRTWLARSLRVADAVICISETTRRSVLEHFDVAADKLHTAHLGVDHVQRVPPPDETTERWLDASGLAGPFVLYAGALDARKNVTLAVDAVERLQRGGLRVPLILAGQRWFGAGPIERHLSQARARGVDVRATGYLEASVFYALMRRAAAFVFPSRYEGFGLPPLEAMSLGVPTVISNCGALPEICGDGARQVGPDDAGTLAEVLHTWLSNPAERQRYVQLAQARAARFTWEKTAAQTAAVYRRVSPA